MKLLNWLIVFICGGIAGTVITLAVLIHLDMLCEWVEVSAECPEEEQIPVWEGDVIHWKSTEISNLNTCGGFPEIDPDGFIISQDHYQLDNTSKPEKIIGYVYDDGVILCGDKPCTVDDLKRAFKGGYSTMNATYMKRN